MTRIRNSPNQDLLGTDSDVPLERRFGWSSRQMSGSRGRQGFRGSWHLAKNSVLG